MKAKMILCIATTLVVSLSFGTHAWPNKTKDLWTFEKITKNMIPVGWKLEATTPLGPLATWGVAKDNTAPNGGKVLSMISPNYDFQHDEDVYHLCWTDKVSYKDVDINVKLKANSGNQDRGGGPIWRVKDKDNYYICRANPNEGNIRLYFVKNGKREEITDAKIDMPSHIWHEIGIKHKGNHIEVSFNGKKLFEADDNTFSEGGGIGLWTKADATVSFNSLSVISPDAKEEQQEEIELSFEDISPGKLPKGWKIEGTCQVGPLSTWEVVREDGAPDGKKTLALTKPNHTNRGTYNLCWTNAVTFQDGEIEVKLKGNTGKIDQGGGPIWRVKDKDNYYICRANPLENNLRLYFVKDGKRQQLASADVEIPSGKWHEIEIEHIGSHIVCELNDKKLLEVDDDTFPKAGGVGLWTKADAATSFDEFEVEFGVEEDDDDVDDDK